MDKPSTGIEVPGKEYSITVFAGADSIDPEDDNVDVEVTLKDGSRWAATFFTLGNIHALMETHAQTGETSGDWFWSANMILVRRLTVDSIRVTVGELLRDGDFRTAFDLLIDDA